MKIKKRKKANIDLFIDSGAFSVSESGAEVNIDDYIDFIKEYEDALNVYACLDVIGDAEKTYKNQKYMESKGLTPLIAFHKGEDYKWLKRYVDEYDYVAIGGIAGGLDVGQQGLVKHLDRCFDIICDRDGMPKVKVHGFGVNSLKIMWRYPWYSVDSTAWVIHAANGFILLPRPAKKGYNWKKQLKVYLSKRNIQSNNNYIMNLSKATYKYVLDYISMKGYRLGDSEVVEVEKNYKLKENEVWASRKRSGEIERIYELGLSNSVAHRENFIVQYYNDLEKQFSEWPYRWKRKSVKGFFK